MYFFVQTKLRIEIQMYIVYIYILDYKYLKVSFPEPGKTTSFGALLRNKTTSNLMGLIST